MYAVITDYLGVADWFDSVVSNFVKVTEIAGAVYPIISDVVDPAIDVDFVVDWRNFLVWVIGLPVGNQFKQTGNHGDRVIIFNQAVVLGMSCRLFVGEKIAV